MEKEELEILERTLNWANGYFTDYMDLKNEYVYSQEEINRIEDEEERSYAQQDRNYEDLLNSAINIIKKYKGVK